MIGVINNSPQQINAALISMKNELKREIITETKIKQYESDVIDDTITSTSKTWSSQKIASEMYPLGFIYMQLYNPNTDSPHWEKDPNELGMTPASGCKWEEITSDFARYPYLKIGSGTKNHGHNAVHGHKIGIWNANNGDYEKRAWKDGTNNNPDGYDSFNNGGRLTVGTLAWVSGSAYRTAGILEDPFGNMGGGGDLAGSTSRQGNVADNTWNELHNYPEPNNSAMKIWKVVEDV